MKDRSTSIILNCSVCGGTDFQYDNENLDEHITCAGCSRVVTREELIEENGGLIENKVAEIKKEIVKDFRKELKKAFKGSKFIKIK